MIAAGAKKFGVLEVLDRRAAHAASVGLDLMALELRNAEAAVAELIEDRRALADPLSGMLRATDFDQNEPWIVAANRALARVGGDV